MRRLLLFLLIVTLCGCERPASQSAPADIVAPVDREDLEVAPEPWRVTGTLLGATETHAIVLADDGIVLVDIQTGDVRAQADTAAEDPVPSFDRHLPRLGVEERDAQPVDRLTDMPIHVGGEVVVFTRGSEDVVTSLVGLDTTTLEEAWTLELAYKRPVRTCQTDAGVLLIPAAPDPARFVDWLGQQAWLREFGDGELQDYRCGARKLQVLMKSGRRFAIRTYESATGDLVEETRATAEAPLTLEPVTITHTGVAQVGDEVVVER